MLPTFYGELVPDNSQLVGYTWLVNEFSLKLPMHQLSCKSLKRLDNGTKKQGAWTIFDSQLRLEDSVFGHLKFALKHEVLDLLLLKRILEELQASEIVDFIKQENESLVSRTIWFYYENLLGQMLDIEDTKIKKYSNLLDSKKYICNENSQKSIRHKVINNHLGNNKICAVVCRTDKLKSFLDMNLQNKAQKITGNLEPSVLQRASRFLLLADSKASFEIEGERAPQNDLERWSKAVMEAGKTEISIKELTRIQALLFKSSKYISCGIRKEGVFLGGRDQNNEPVPEFIGAKEEELEQILNALIELNNQFAESKLDPMIHAAIISFAFVFIHPFVDGNGRIHRYLIHQILASRKFYPNELVFPISSAMKENLDGYSQALKGYSSHVMEQIEWESTESKNVKVLNNTKDFYTFINFTEIVEFLFECAEVTIEKLIREEIEYLNAFDKSFKEINHEISLADNDISLLISCIFSNEGILSKRKKEKFFDHISQEDIETIEEIVRENFRI